MKSTIFAPTLSALPASNEVSDNYLWEILSASGGGTRIRNVATEQYLKSGGTTNSLEATLPSSSTNDYDYFVWRLANANMYGNTSAYSKRELTSGFGIGDERIDVHDTSDLTLTNAASNCLWASFDDFSYEYSNNMFFEYSDEGFTGISRGPAIQVTATHKVTGLSTTFNITINSNIETFAWRLGQLYDIAKAFKSQSQKKTLELVFNFIRGQKYGGGDWDGVVGDWNQTFVSFVQNNYHEIYSYFVCDSAQIYNNDYIIMVYDQASEDYVDVLHMSYTINRLLYDGETVFQSYSMTIIREAIISGGAVVGFLAGSYIGALIGGLEGVELADQVEQQLQQYADDLSGWAGDLQTLIKDYFKYFSNSSNTYDQFYYMIGHNSYRCSHSDIISDIDAVLLVKRFDVSINSGSDFKNLIEYYYANDSFYRFTLFINSRTNEELVDYIKKYCQKELPINIMFFEGVEIVDWPFLKTYTISSEQQNAFASAFVNYLFTFKGWEDILNGNN